MTIYHFIYKTIHTNGNYYYGRHSTSKLDDGYLGSGMWIKSIKKTSNLTREIIEFSDSVENLKILEKKYLEEHFGKPGCMNRTKDTDGYTSEESKQIQERRVKEGIHHLLGGKIQGKTSRRRVKEGTHNFLDREKTRKIQLKRSENGTHHFLGGEIQKKLADRMIKEGTHNFLGPETQRKRISNGSHNFLGGNIVKIKCNYCGKEGHPGAMKRWHFNNCKYKN